MRRSVLSAPLSNKLVRGAVLQYRHRLVWRRLAAPSLAAPTASGDLPAAGWSPTIIGIAAKCLP